MLIGQSKNYSDITKSKVCCHKEDTCYTENTYSKINIEAVCTAARVLSDKTFKLYMRMNLHQDNYTYGLSPEEIKKNSGTVSRTIPCCSKGNDTENVSGIG